MIDIKIVRENPEEIEKAAKDKGVKINATHILEIDAKKRELEAEVQKLREERNANSAGIKGKPTAEQIQKGQEIKTKLEQKEHALTAVEEELHKNLLEIPNPAKKDVHFGMDEKGNEVAKKVGKPRKFDFTPKDHLELGEALGIIDVKRAAKISGARFYYLKNEGASIRACLKTICL